MKSIHVLRKPCSESTVAANVLRHGTGALNIDASRINHVLVAGGSLALNPHLRQGIKRGQSLNPTAFALGDDGLGTCNPAGRWPANLVLQHLEGCRPDGTREVATSTAHQINGTTGGFVYGDMGNKRVGTPTVTYANENGKETIVAWFCVHGCPVATLDRSGLTSVTGHRSSRSATAEVKGTTWGTTNHQSREYPNDSGSASRFFKQVKS